MISKNNIINSITEYIEYLPGLLINMSEIILNYDLVNSDRTLLSIPPEELRIDDLLISLGMKGNIKICIIDEIKFDEISNCYTLYIRKLGYNKGFVNIAWSTERISVFKLNGKE